MIVSKEDQGKRLDKFLTEQYDNFSRSVLQKLIKEGEVEWATNETGFSALLAGYRDTGGNFYELSYDTGFWSSSEENSITADILYLHYLDNDVSFDNYYKNCGFSIRCIKD